MQALVIRRITRACMDNPDIAWCICIGYVYVLDITVNFMLSKRKSKKAAGGAISAPPKPPCCHGRRHAPSRTLPQLWIYLSDPPFPKILDLPLFVGSSFSMASLVLQGTLSLPVPHSLRQASTFRTLPITFPFSWPFLFWVCMIPLAFFGLFLCWVCFIAFAFSWPFLFWVCMIPLAFSWPFLFWVCMIPLAFSWPFLFWVCMISLAFSCLFLFQGLPCRMPVPILKHRLELEGISHVVSLFSFLDVKAFS